MSTAKSVVLVHGAFADGSGWTRVIAILQGKGLRVVSVQNPLTSLADDVAHTRRALAAVTGPVVLVGHSWGGAVITEGGVNEKVSALVYVAAFAPDAGESANDSLKEYPPSRGLSHLSVDAEGFATLSADGMASNFAQDVSKAETAVMAAAQGPIQVACFDTILTQAAWRTKPAWYIVCKRDRMLPVELLRATARRMKARVTELEASHVPQASRPDDVAAVIVEAASA
jgi:pimeloyl-ACP methyl ester carboxylesterase